MAEANPNSTFREETANFATESRDQSRHDCLDMLHNMDSALAALRYLDTLLDLAVNADGGALADQHSGLHCLMASQLESMADGVELLRSYIRREEKGTDLAPAANLPEWHDIATIATRSRVHRSEVARIMFVLTGQDYEGEDYRAWDGNLSEGLHSHLLSGLCWEALARGDMWGKISTATGLSLGQVREVLDAMLAYSPKREAIELGPIAQDLKNRAALANQAADLSQIARDTNVEEETVRRVVDRLQADPSAVMPPEPTAKAVNN